jgi:hypothetical protein
MRDELHPYEAVAAVRDRMAPGSMLVIGHGTADSRPDDYQRLVELSKQTPTPMATRSHADIMRFFDGFDVVDPGLTWVSLWRPESPDDVPEEPGRSANYGGVGRRS